MFTGDAHRPSGETAGSSGQLLPTARSMGAFLRGGPCSYSSGWPFRSSLATSRQRPHRRATRRLRRRAPAPAAESALVGTIEHFEASARRLVLQTASDAHIAFTLAPDAIIRLGLADVAAGRARIPSRTESQGPLHPGQWPAHGPLGRDLVRSPSGRATLSDTAAIRSRRENRARSAVGRSRQGTERRTRRQRRRRGRREWGQPDRLRGAGVRAASTRSVPPTATRCRWPKPFPVRPSTSSASGLVSTASSSC